MKRVIIFLTTLIVVFAIVLAAWYFLFLPKPEVPPEASTAGPGVGSTIQWYDNAWLVYVPEGEFTMGGDYEDNPPHTAFLNDFWVYKFKVTNDMYRLCVASQVCDPPANEPPVPCQTK